MSSELIESTNQLREKRKQKFEETWLFELVEITEVVERDNGSYTFTTKEHGTIDYFPKANKLLIRKQNKWIKPGLKWIIKNVLL